MQLYEDGPEVDPGWLRRAIDENRASVGLPPMPPPRPEAWIADQESPCAGRVTYRSGDLALFAVDKLYGYEGAPRDPIECPACGYWHMTPREPMKRDRKES